jgi:hypothetical protein
MSKSLASFFGKVSKKEEVPTAPVIKVEISATDAKLDAFFASLTPAQRLAHTIAKEKLGSSYDIERTHDYNAYLKK